jgi:hypothetical protein
MRATNPLFLSRHAPSSQASVDGSVAGPIVPPRATSLAHSNPIAEDFKRSVRASLAESSSSQPGGPETVVSPTSSRSVMTAFLINQTSPIPADENRKGKMIRQASTNDVKAPHKAIVSNGIKASSEDVMLSPELANTLTDIKLAKAMSEIAEVLKDPKNSNLSLMISVGNSIVMRIQSPNLSRL